MTMLFRHTNYASLLRPSPMRTAVFRHTKYAALLRPSPLRTAVFRHAKYAALLHCPFFTEATSRLEPGVKKGWSRTAHHFTYRKTYASSMAFPISCLIYLFSKFTHSVALYALALAVFKSGPLAVTPRTRPPLVTIPFSVRFVPAWNT